METAMLARRLIHGGTWALTGKIGITLLVLATNAVLARILDPGSLGEYFLILSIVTVMAMIAQMGFNQAIVKVIAESMGLDQPGTARYAISMALGILLMMVIILAVFHATVLAPWLAITVLQLPAIAEFAWLSSLWFGLLALQGLLAEIFRGFHDIRAAVLVGGLVTNLAVVAGLSLLWLNPQQVNLSAVLWVMIVATALNVAVALAALKRRTSKIIAVQDYPLSHLLKLAIPAWISVVVLLLTRHADIWILGAYVAKEDLALYGTATRMADVVSLPLMVANAVMPPVIAELYARGNKTQLQRALQTTATLASLPAIAAVLIFAAGGGWLLEIVFGSYYREGTLLLIVLSSGHLMNVLTGTCGLTLIMTGHQMSMMLITLISGLLLVTGSLMVVVPYGTTGVAVVAASVMVLQNLVFLLIARAKTGILTCASLQAMHEVRNFRMAHISDQQK
ncbi:MAG: oligosaccharide flippase family protein [Gammaproteobacteria bacterium]|nr:oligosaccharide flippase family protein [Gammaproteobacteria bacterium]